MIKWRSGFLDETLFSNTKAAWRQTVNNQKAFCRLIMLQGRIRKALKYIIDSESLAGGVHNLTKEILEQLRLYKHPPPGSEDPSVLPDITPE